MSAPSKSSLSSSVSFGVGKSKSQCEGSFRSLFENSFDAILLATPEGDILVANPAACNMFGMSEDELKKAGRSGILVCDERAKCFLEEKEKTGRARAELTYRRKDGSAFEGEIAASFFTDADGIAKVVIIIRDIMARKQAEEALRRSEQRFYSVFEKTAIGIATGTPEGQIVESNFAFQQMLGYSEAELKGKNFSEITHSEDLKKEWALLKEMLTKKKDHYEMEKRYIRKDGKAIWVHIIGNVVFGANHEPVMAIATVIDITKRIKAEQALRRSEIRFRSLYKNSLDGVLLTKPDGAILSANPAAQQMFGMSEEEIKQAGRAGLVVLDENFYAAFNERQRTGKMHGEFTYKRKDGSTFIGEATSSIFTDSDGTVKTSMIIRDISERKKAQEELAQYTTNLEGIVEQRTSQLALERERFFSIVEDLPVMVCLITPDYQVPYANRLFREKFGASAGQPCYVYCGTQSSPCSMCESMVPLKTGKPHHWVAHFPNGLYVEAWDFPFTDVDGKKMILEVDVDITERMNLQKQLAEKERLAAIGQTAGMVGHDIRNPLQAIMSDVYLLEDYLSNMPQCQTKEDVKESLESIEKNIDYINKIVADLQDYAKPLKPEPVKIEDLCSTIKELFSTLDVPSNIKAEIGCAKTLPVLNLDLTFLKRILVNLATNAIQAMPNGGKLCVKIYNRADKVQIVVEDTGVGIPDELKPKMFTPLLTTKSKGQGFGLPVVKRYTEALGGTISFESQEGKGTKFTIELPQK